MKVILAAEQIDETKDFYNSKKKETCHLVNKYLNSIHNI
jgi:hypothetical protein